MAWSRAEDEVRSFIERTQIPFLRWPMGKGVMPDDDPARPLESISPPAFIPSASQPFSTAMMRRTASSRIVQITP